MQKSTFAKECDPFLSVLRDWLLEVFDK